MKVTGKPHSTAPCPRDDLVIPRRQESPDLLKRSSNKGRSRKGRTRNPRVKLVAGTGRRSRPETPLLKWKIEEGEEDKVEDQEEEEEEKGRRRRRRKGGEKPVSARKLAAGLWRLKVPETVGGGVGGGRRNERLGFQPGASHVGITFVPDCNGKIYSGEVKDPLHSPSCVSGGRNRFLCKLEPSFQFSNSAMEGATKWDPVCLEPSDEVFQIYSHMKRIDQQVSAVTVVARLEAELEQARSQIQELETERQSSKKKLENFLKKVSEERAAWRSREHEKVRAFIDDIKADLSQERKNRQRLEIVNSKLVNELADAKVSAKRFMKDCEKERKARELIEEVCDELAKEIEEDKAEVEALKRESMKFRDEVDKERKMLQMAEVWREERVQMKLIDAKVALEEKYSLMNKLVSELENFLRSRNTTPDLIEMREAESLLQAAALVNIQDIKDFKYEPPNPDDIYSVFEDVNFAEPNEREIEPCATYSLASPFSKIHTVSPEMNMMKKDANFRHSNAFVDQNDDLEDDESGWETVSHLEDQGSSYSPEESALSVNRNHHDSNVSGSGTEWEEHACNESPITEINELYSLPTKHFKKVSSIARLWRSAPNNGDNYKEVISVDGVNGRLSNRRKANSNILSPDPGSGKGGLSPTDLVDQWSSPESGNPHITRAMKGCIEWPRGIQKTSLKSKLFEARMESQKVQIRHVLKQKI